MPKRKLLLYHAHGQKRNVVFFQLVCHDVQYRLEDSRLLVQTTSINCNSTQRLTCLMHIVKGRSQVGPTGTIFYI